MPAVLTWIMQVRIQPATCSNLIITPSPVIFTLCGVCPKKESLPGNYYFWNCDSCVETYTAYVCVCVCAWKLKSEQDVCVGISPRPPCRNLLPPVLRRWGESLTLTFSLYFSNETGLSGWLIGQVLLKAALYVAFWDLPNTQIYLLSCWGLFIDFCWF